MLGRTWRILVCPGEVPRLRCGAGGGVPNLMGWPLVKVKTPGTATVGRMGCRGVRERVGEEGRDRKSVV